MNKNDNAPRIALHVRVELDAAPLLPNVHLAPGRVHRLPFFGAVEGFAVLVFFGGLAFETALIEWGAGTWPQRDTPWISLGLIMVSMLVMTVDIIVMGLHNWRFERRQKSTPDGPTAR